MYTVGRLNYDPSKAQIIECQRGEGGGGVPKDKRNHFIFALLLVYKL
jgi:hypothetical protein